MPPPAARWSGLDQSLTRSEVLLSSDNRMVSTEGHMCLLWHVGAVSTALITPDRWDILTLEPVRMSVCTMGLWNSSGYIYFYYSM